MDPLSIIASSLTVAATAQAGLGILFQLLGAKSELCALSNELSDLTLVLQQASQFTDEEQLKLADSPELSLVASNTHRKLQDLKQQVEECTEIWQHKRRKAVLVLSKLKSSRAALQTLRFQLIAVLSASTSVTLNHLHLSVHSISTTVHQLAAQQQRDLHTHTTNMQTITERLQSIETFMNPQRVSRQPPDVVTLASHTTHGSSVKPSADNTLVCSNLANYSTASLAQYVDRGSVVTALAIQARQASRYTCKSYCRCSCHQEKVARSSPMLDLIIGSLFIGYSGQPSLLNPCDAGDCKKRCASHFQVTYVFPRWFLAKVVTVAVTAVPAAGPQAFFAVHRSVSPTSEIFYHAKSGNVEKLKELFRLGAASPNDVHCASGVVALDFAISYRKLDAIKFLLQAGADPFIRSKKLGACPADKAWSKILTKSLQPKEESAFRELFVSNGDLDARNLTTLHKIVLGLHSRNLEDELRATLVDVNAQDALGMTPLALATECGRETDVMLLLSYGANPSTPSYCQKDPLCYAARARSAACTALLLQAGASATYHSSYGHTALHYAGIWAPGTVVDLLVAAGAPVDFADKDGRTPLGFTVVSGNLDAAARLLAHGARIRTPAALNADPVLYGIRENRHPFLRLFVAHGFDAAVPLPKGQTLLHVLAESADELTMAIFSKCRMANVFIGKADDDGKTAIQIVGLRATEQGRMSLRESFHLMLHSLLQLGFDELEEGDQWEDAVEIQ